MVNSFKDLNSLNTKVFLLLGFKAELSPRERQVGLILGESIVSWSMPFFPPYDP